MKNKRIAKLITVALALVLLIGSAIGVAVSAESTKTPEIISKNVYYAGNSSIMYAVDADTVNEGPVTLYLFDDEAKANAETPDTEWVYTAEAPTVQNIGGENKSVYIINTLGIAPARFTDNFYAYVVDATGAKSAVVKYSLLEYYLDMLYRNGYVNAAEGEALAQKTAYEAAIANGSALQNLLLNYDEDDANDIDVLADEYLYACIVDGATLDGTSGAGIFAPGAKVTPTSTDGSVAKWLVTTYAANGSVSTETVADGTEITLAGHTVITEAPVPTTGVYDFEDGIPAALKATEANASGSVTLGNDADAGDNYMLFNTTGAGSADTLPSFTVPVKTSDNDADTFVFGYDMKLDTVTFKGVDKYVGFLCITAYAGDETVYSLIIAHNGDRIRVYTGSGYGTDISKQNSAVADSWRVSRQEDQTTTNTYAHTERRMFFAYDVATDTLSYYNANGLLFGTYTNAYGANLLPDKVVVTAVDNATKLSARLDNVVAENYKAESEDSGVITFDPHTLNNLINITENEGAAVVKVDENTGDNYLYVKSENLQSVNTSYRNPNMTFPIATTEGANTYEFSADINILYLENGWSLVFKFGGYSGSFGLKYYAGATDNRLKFTFSGNTNSATLPELLVYDKVSNGDGYTLGTEFNFRFVATVVGDTTEIRVYRDGVLVNEEPIIYATSTLIDSAYLECGKEMNAEFTLDNVYSATTVVSGTEE